MQSIDGKEYYASIRPYLHLDLWLLGIIPCLPHGSFSVKRTGELLKFCENNQDIHIVSVIDPLILVNQYIEGASEYYLADGDNNPNLYYDCGAQLERIKSLNSGKTNDLPNLTKSNDVDTPFLDLSDSRTFNTISRLLYAIMISPHRMCTSELPFRKNSRNDKK